MGDESSPIDVDKFWSALETRAGIILADGTIVTNRNNTVSENAEEFVRQLFDFGAISRDDLPILIGDKRFFLAPRPTNKLGEVMKNPKEPVPGVFVETDYSHVQLGRRMYSCATEVGLVSDDK